MRSNIQLLGLVLCTLFISLCSAHNIQLGAHSRECFHEALRKDDKMTVTFQVGDREFGGSGNIEIDFWVRLAAMYLITAPPMLGASHRQVRCRTASSGRCNHRPLYAEPPCPSLPVVRALPR